MQYMTDGHEKFIWFHHTGKEHFFDLDEDPLECREFSRHPDHKSRLEVWRKRLADFNETRGDPRGRDGQLIPQPNGAFSLSPNYEKWRDAAQKQMDG